MAELELTAGLPQRIWSGFTSWRRGRPFWAGIVLAAAGAELLLLPLPIHAMGLILHIGTGGVLGILIGAILIACALLLWFNPAQKTFYSIVAVLLAVAALVASNLGGFLIGTILGVIGGSFAFAWTPDQHGRSGPPAGLMAAAGSWRHRLPHPGGRPDTSTGTGTGSATGSATGTATGGETGGRPETGGKPNPPVLHSGLPLLLGVPILPTVLAALLAILHLSPAAAGSGPSPAQSPSPALCKSLASLPPGEPSLISSAAKQIAQVCTSLGLDPGSSSGPAASSSPRPGGGSGAGGGTGSGGGVGLGANPLPSPSISLGLRPSPGASPRPAAGASPSPSIKIASKASAPAVTLSSVPATLTAKSATIKGFVYDGQVSVRLPDGTVEQVMRFTMTSLDLTDIDLTAGQGSRAVTTMAPGLDLTGNVVMYATELSGDLYGGVPVTLTPSSPVAIVLKAISGLTKKVPVDMTNVVADQPYTSGNSMSIKGLDIS
jgi:hypothetical protein